MEELRDRSEVLEAVAAAAIVGYWLRYRIICMLSAEAGLTPILYLSV